MVRGMIMVVGAVGIDMVAMRERFLDGTSNPSDIRVGLGGVGYRIFSNLDAPRRFVTALAADPISRWAREALEADSSVAIQDVKGRDAGPPLYLALMESGSLKVAASDFRIVEQALSADFVERALGDPGPSDFLVLDANLSAGLLGRLVEKYGQATRVVVEPVSVEKAARHARALHDLFLLTPTGEEMEALGVRDVPRFMADRRIATIIVTRGGQGLSLYRPGAAREDFTPGTLVEARDTTGAGDLLLSALLSFLHQGAEMRDAVRRAMRAVEDRLSGRAP
jgi:sugar/nucleoside kinase (ribokinase family)